MITNLAFVVMLTVLGVQWVRLSHESWEGNLAWFHIAAIVFALCVMCEAKARRALVEVQRTAWPITLGTAVYVVMLLSAVGLLDEHFASKQIIVRQVFSLAIFVSTAGFIVSRLRDGTGSILLCIAVATAFGFTVAMMARALSSSGQNPWWVLTQALQSGNTNDFIFGLFRNAFSAGLKGTSLEDVEVRSNLRHGIISALLCSALISQLFLAQAKRVPAIIKHIAIGGTISVLLFTLVSLSRSMMLILAIYALVLTGLWFVQKKYIYVIGSISVITFISVFVFSYSRLGTTLENRVFSETSAYQGRLLGIQLAMEEINRHPLFPDASGAKLPSPHNFLFDAWLGGGLIAAVAALVSMVTIAVLWARLAAWSASGEHWARWQMCAPILGAGIIPMVRFVTAGSGTLHLGEWISLALFVGGWHYMHSLRSATSIPSPLSGGLTQRFPQLLR